MVELWLAVGLAAVAAVAVPLLLAAAFHGADRVDARGRRVNRAWRARRPR